MKKRLFSLAFLPLLLIGCAPSEKYFTPEPQRAAEVVEENENYETHVIEHPRKKGEMNPFHLLSPENDFVTNHGFTFTWEEVSNADSYQLEVSSREDFEAIYDDDVLLKETNLATNSYNLTFYLPKKDIDYYWRVTAVNKDHTQLCAEGYRTFFYESIDVGELEIEIEDAEDWAVHKEGSQAKVSIDKNNFFGNDKNSLVISFTMEDTKHDPVWNEEEQEYQSLFSDGWMVITKAEDRELYGTDSFYMDFFYAGHDATVLIRVLDFDGEYWQNQVSISNNAKQSIIMKYSDFELRDGPNVYNKTFDWQHIRSFEVVFERTFGDGVCILSDIKAVKFENYKHMFVDVMDFNSTDSTKWKGENCTFEKTISEDGRELTIGYAPYNAETNPTGMVNGWGVQHVDVNKLLVKGEALQMQVKYTGSSNDATFLFRVLEEDGDLWIFKISISAFTRDEYTTLAIPLKAFQRPQDGYMAGDGAKQFYFIKKFQIGISNNYAPGTISVKDLTVVKMSDLTDSRTRVVGMDGMIENFDSYKFYTEMYYFWEQSSVNKDEAMKLDTLHKVGGRNNKQCAEFDYKADMEMAVYQLYMDTKSVNENLNAFSFWMKDDSKLFEDPAVTYLGSVSAELTIQLTMETGEYYRYIIPKLEKDWTNYTIKFSDFFLQNKESIFDQHSLASNKIMHMAFGFKYLYYDESGKAHPTYAIANPVYLDNICFTQADKTSFDMLDTVINEDKDNPGIYNVDNFEKYNVDDDLFDYWSYGSEKDYNSITLFKEENNQSIKMHYKGWESVSYVRATPMSQTAKAKALVLDIKGDGKATIYLNLNWRVGSTLLKMRYTLSYLSTEWTEYTIGFKYFTPVGSSSQKRLNEDETNVRNIESISFGIVNGDYSASDIYVDNIRFSYNVSFGALIPNDD